jgi:hypothetical protein
LKYNIIIIYHAIKIGVFFVAVGKDKTRILLTLPLDLKEELTDEAKDDNRSLNNYILNLLLSSERRTESSRD